MPARRCLTVLIGATFAVALSGGLVGCAGDRNGNVPVGVRPGGDSSDRTGGVEVPPEEKLARIERTWEKYQETSETGANYRRMKAGVFREKVFDRALIAYWHIHDGFPQGESVEDVIAELEGSSLVPFWPLDPEAGDPMRIVGGAEEVSEWEDVYLELADNGAFDYTMEMYRPAEPHSAFVDTYLSSEHMDDLEKVLYLPPEAGHPEPIVLPTDPSEVFADMICSWFVVMVTESFLASEGELPLSLEDLFAGRLTVHKEGWGHPVGARDNSEVGDFECGVDPTINGYYWEVNTSRGIRSLVVFRFVKTEIAEEMVYDTSIHPGGTLAKMARDTELVSRIPLLTDELFAGPPPDL